MRYQDHANCDTSVASAGEACFGEDDEMACSPDRQHAVVCKNGTFAPWLECRGKNGCTMNGRRAECDVSVARKGDPCKVPDALACGDDGASLLVCRNGAFDAHRACRGAAGCMIANEAPVCDQTLSLAGDPCGTPGQVVCAADGKTELWCQGGTFVKSLACKNGCTVSARPGHPIECR